MTEASTEHSAYANSFRADGFSLRQVNRRLYRNPAGSANALPETILPVGGFLRETNATREVYTFRGQADWDALDNETHLLNLLAGTEIILNQYNQTRLNGFGFIFANGTSYPDELALIRSIRLNRGDETDDYYALSRFTRNQLSFYGSLNYTFLNKYILTGSLRNDATNVSGNSLRNRFLPTWSVGGAWLASQEPFMKNMDNILSVNKLRASYGLRGNAGNRGPELVARLGNQVNVYPEYGQLVVNVSEPVNEDIEWEKEHIVSAGIDMTLFDLFDVTADYYHRKNFDLIGERSVAPSLGYATKQLNWATMTNEGVEVSVSVRPIEIFNDLRWQGLFNIGYNKNTVASNYIGNDPTLYTAAGIKDTLFRAGPLTVYTVFGLPGWTRKDVLNKIS